MASLNRPGGTPHERDLHRDRADGKAAGVFARNRADVALLVNPKSTIAESQIKDALEATRVLGQRLHVVNASSESEIDDAFATMQQLKADALLVSTDPLFGFLHAKQIVDLAARDNNSGDLPFAPRCRGRRPDGAGANLPDTWRQAGVYEPRPEGRETVGPAVMQPARSSS